MAGSVYRLGVAAADGVPVGGSWEVARTSGDEPHTVVGVGLVMSTFGLDDDAFAEVERRWTAWWSGT